MLYRWLWRWHFYVGLVVTPFLMLMAVTGALYCFKPQIEARLHPELFRVTERAGRAPLQPQLDAALARAPGLIAESFFADQGPGRPNQIYLMDPHGGDAARWVYLDPHDGRVLGATDPARGDFFGAVVKLHRTLYAGTGGRWLTELTASWGLVMLVTGFCLWWLGRRGRPPAPRTVRARRRNWHLYPALGALPFAALLMMTGLLFTANWRPAFLAVGRALRGVPATYAKPPELPARDPTQTLRRLDDLMAIARRESPTGPARLRLPRTPTAPVTVQIGGSSERPFGMSWLWLNPVTGEVIDSIPWHRMPLAMKYAVVGYSLHIGSWGGILTQILACIASLSIAWMGFSGLRLWWARRPRGKLGAPRPWAQPEPLPRLVLALTLALALLLPTVGYTLAASIAISALRGLRRGS